MRERETGEAGEASFLARVVPDEARVVGLVYPEGELSRASAVAASIASTLGLHRKHTLLAATESGSGSLDELLGGANSRGLFAAFTGQARLSEIARREERGSYLYLPAGRRAPPPAELLSSAEFRRFAERVRSQGGTLLLHIPETALRGPGVASLLDGYVSLGKLTGASSTAVEYGRVNLPEPAPLPSKGIPDAPESGPKPTRWGRHRVRSTPPAARLVIGGLFIVILMVGWWILAGRTINMVTAPNSADSFEPAEVTPAATDLDSAMAGSSEGGKFPNALLAAAQSASELPYSVLIASYAGAGDAEQVAAELSRGQGTLFFVAPTPVGAVLYFRVFAGALSTQARSQALMDELVRGGHKDTGAEWDMRPVRLAYRLGIFARREDAQAAVRGAAAVGIPAYFLEARGTSSNSAFVLYAGAYESEDEARALGILLERAGRGAELVIRRGETR